MSSPLDQPVPPDVPPDVPPSEEPAAPPSVESLHPSPPPADAQPQPPAAAPFVTRRTAAWQRGLFAQSREAEAQRVAKRKRDDDDDEADLQQALRDSLMCPIDAADEAAQLSVALHASSVASFIDLEDDDEAGELDASSMPGTSASHGYNSS